MEGLLLFSQFIVSYIARHEASLFLEAKALRKSTKGDHPSKGFNGDILALSLPLVEAIGCRMAFEAAQVANISPKVFNLYESGVVKEDSSWYAEKGGLSRELRREMEAQAADDLLPHLKGIILRFWFARLLQYPHDIEGFVERICLWTGDI